MGESFLLQAVVDQRAHDTDLWQPQPEKHHLRAILQKDGYRIPTPVPSLVKVVAHFTGDGVHISESPLLVFEHESDLQHTVENKKM